MPIGKKVAQKRKSRKTKTDPVNEAGDDDFFTENKSILDRNDVVVKTLRDVSDKNPRINNIGSFQNSKPFKFHGQKLPNALKEKIFPILKTEKKLMDRNSIEKTLGEFSPEKEQTEEKILMFLRAVIQNQN